MDATRPPGAIPVARPGASEGADAGAKSGPSPAVRLILIVAGAIALLAIIAFGVKYIAYASAHESTDDATVDADEVQITSKIAERVDRILVNTNDIVKKGQLVIALDSVDESDRVEQAQAADAAARAQAKAADANVVLTRDTQNAENLQGEGAIAQARAAIDSASASAVATQQQIAVASAGADAMRAEYKSAQAGIPAAEQNLRKAAADLSRTQSLYSTGDESKAQLDAARATYEGARSQYAQARSNVASAYANYAQAIQKVTSQRSSADSSDAQIGVQQANLTTAQGKLQESSAPSRVLTQEAQAEATRAQIASTAAQLAVAKTNLSYTQIRSPINGYVGQKNVEIGQTVSPGESLMTLIPATGVYITANFKETQVGHMKVGQEVDISVDAYKGVNFVGHVDNLSPAAQNKFSLVPAQNATGNFVKVTQRLPVRILFDKVEGGDGKTLGDYALRPGMSVETSVKVK
jgi:membrane fusion protein (multidrug efflux system)